MGGYKLTNITEGHHLCQDFAIKNWGSLKGLPSFSEKIEKDDIFKSVSKVDHRLLSPSLKLDKIGGTVSPLFQKAGRHPMRSLLAWMCISVIW